MTARLRSWVAALALAVLIVPLPVASPGYSMAVESTCSAEVEPNDMPESATVNVAAGCLEGSLPDGDQDFALWTIGQEDATQRWTITLDGVWGAVTAGRILPVTSAPGVVPPTVGTALAELAAGPYEDGEARLQDFMLAPGQYVIGVSRSGWDIGVEPGPTDYRLAIDAGAPPVNDGDHEPNDDPSAAATVTDAFELAGEGGGSPDYYSWTIGTDPEERWWGITAQAPLGSHLVVTISDLDDAPLVRAEAYLTGRTTIPDLALGPGAFHIRVETIGERPTSYILAAAATPAVDADPEPNDTIDTAIAVALGTVVSGRLERPGATDTFRLEVDEQMAGTLFDAKLLWFQGPARDLCLFRPTTDSTTVEQLQCLRGADGVALRSLALAPGTYAFTIRGDASLDSPYYLRLDATAPVEPDYEAEPNDKPTLSTLTTAQLGLRGRLSPGDPDFVRVRIDDGPQLWSAEATGTGLSELSLLRFDGTSLAHGQVEPGGSRAILQDLYLPPGEHMFVLRGTSGEYDLALSPLGPPDPAAEREPNDDATTAERLEMGRERFGRVPTTSDVDNYRFSLTAPEHILLTLVPPPSAAVDLSIEQGTTSLARIRGLPGGEAFDYDALLDPGEYRISVRASGTAIDGRYSLLLQHADAFVVADDVEPNDEIGTARPLQRFGTIIGTGDGRDRADWFLLEVAADDAPLVVRVMGDVSDLLVADASQPSVTAPNDLIQDGDDGTIWRSGPLTPGMPLAMRVVANGPYRLTLGDVAAGPPVGPLPVELSVRLPDDPPAGYWPMAQRLEGELHVANGSTRAMQLVLDAVSTDPDWRIGLADHEIDLAPGASETVPLSVELRADARAGVPVRLSLQARDADGAQSTTFVEVTPDATALPIGEHQGWPLPEALLGGMDVARIDLGGAIIPSLDPIGEEALHDGIALTGAGLDRTGVTLPVTLSVDLASEDAVPIAGVILDPLAGDGLPEGTVADFELLLSEDGVAYEEVLAAAMSTSPREQSFVLDEPVEARYAQLRVRSVHGPRSDRLKLGEWKVVASPGVVPRGLSLDIGDPDRGGHVATLSAPGWDPPLDLYQRMLGMLTSEPDGQRFDAAPGSTVAWVLGFRDGRAARVERIGWVDSPQADAGHRAERVMLWSSLDSPFGPWEPLGDWTLQRGADGTVAPFMLSAPTWVRYLRFETGPVPEDGRLELPTAIPVFEALEPGIASSVLGEWGAGNLDGPYERAQPALPESEPDESDVADDMAQAVPLAAAQTVRGRVHRGEDVDWYAVSVPDGQNSLTFTIAGVGGMGAALRLVDDDGEDVPLRFAPGGRPTSVIYAANVVPASEYRLEVLQPASSVVVAFDESQSLAAWLPVVSQALRTYAAGIEPGQEAMQLVPFEQEALLEEWTDDPWVVRAAVEQRYLATGGSGAEDGLLVSTDLLATRDGPRAILTITDAETTTTLKAPDLWDALERVRPSIHTLQVGGGGAPLISPRLMQDWAAAGQGIAQYARSRDDIDRAFERLAAWLRRPAGYELSFQTSESSLPPLAPGRLSVVTTADPVTGEPGVTPVGSGVAIELVLDTSGSMRKRLGGERRIELAKRVLTSLVEQSLPPGTPVALRAFSQQRGACESELVVPLGPLSPEAMRARIKSLRALNRTPTPLAKAIAAVAEDLADEDGHKVVVVVSDGLENCGGDPEEAVRSLVERGFDVTVNVVGLDLDRLSRRRIARLAAIGGGIYFDARDQTGLESALRAALSAPFEVFDPSGALIASGAVNGDFLEVPPGTYRVVVLTEPPQTFDGILVEAQGEVSLAIYTREPIPAP